MTETSPTERVSPPRSSPRAALGDRHVIVARHDLAACAGDGRCGLIRLQVFNPDGSAWGPEITVDAAAGDNPFHPAIAALADGRFALAWQEPMGPDLSPRLALRIQVFNADGSPWVPSPFDFGGISGDQGR